MIALRRGAAAVVLVALALVGCSASGGGGDEGIAEDAGRGDGGAAPMDPADPADPADPDARQVILTASADVTVEDPAAAADDVAALADAAGGRVEGREEYAPAGGDDAGSATLVLRVPSAELSGLLDDLDGIGEVRSITQSEDDVTGTVQDLDARIAALETSTGRLLEIMAAAEDTGDLLDIEDALSERQAELESLQSQRDALADQVALSTLTVTMSAEPPPPAEARGGFVGGLQSGWDALVGFVGSALVVLGALLPWVVALGVPTLAVLGWRRRRRATPSPPAA